MKALSVVAAVVLTFVSLHAVVGQDRQLEFEAIGLAEWETLVWEAWENGSLETLPKLIESLEVEATRQERLIDTLRTRFGEETDDNAGQRHAVAISLHWQRYNAFKAMIDFLKVRIEELEFQALPDEEREAIRRRQRERLEKLIEERDAPDKDDIQQAEERRAAQVERIIQLIENGSLDDFFAEDLSGLTPEEIEKIKEAYRRIFEPDESFTLAKLIQLLLQRDSDAPTGAGADVLKVRVTAAGEPVAGLTIRFDDGSATQSDENGRFETPQDAAVTDVSGPHIRWTVATGDTDQIETEPSDIQVGVFTGATWSEEDRRWVCSALGDKSQDVEHELAQRGAPGLDDEHPLGFICGTGATGEINIPEDQRTAVDWDQKPTEESKEVRGGTFTEIRIRVPSVAAREWLTGAGREVFRQIVMKYVFELLRERELLGKGAVIEIEIVSGAQDAQAASGDTEGDGPSRLAKAVSALADPHLVKRGSWGQEYEDQWALRRVGFLPAGGDQPSAWPSSWPLLDARLQPCTVAVIGCGVDWTHPDLINQMWVNPAEKPFNGMDDDKNGYVDDVYGWNFLESCPNVMDRGGHDTHAAGVIAAQWYNSYGIAGINPRARIMALKVADLRGEANSVAISQAIFYAVKHGARVINISYGGAQSRLEQIAIDYARSQGVLVVVAAGNAGKDAVGQAPAGCEHAFTVAGTTLKDGRAGFSNWGQPVDLAAPSMDVLSLRAKGSDFLLYLTEHNPDYVAGTGVVGGHHDLYRASGTSFAAPLVAGTASLIFSLRPELTAEQVEHMLLMSAADVETPGWDQYTGEGLLDARKAIAADPNYFLSARITAVQAARRNGQLEIDVYGRATGSDFRGRWLQIAFGDKPATEDWSTVKYDRQPQPQGLLGSIPLKKFERPGVWSIRVLIQDGRKLVKQGRSTLNLE